MTQKETRKFHTAMGKFEVLWAKYVEALEALDSAREQEGGHAPRMRRAAAKRVRVLAARLASEYDMDVS